MDFRDSAAYALCTPMARFATRPGGSSFSGSTDNISPDLIMGTLMRGGRHLLKSDYIYELVMNNMTGIMELHPVGKSTIGKQWGRPYYDIAIDGGSRVWLSQDETKELEKNENEEGN